MMRVLVIETSGPLREQLRAMLAADAWPTQVTSSAATGLAIATWFRPTVILFGLSDATMEPSLFATLVRDSLTDPVSIVAVTAGEGSLPTGFDARLAVPFSMEALERAIRGGEESGR
jgi:DNA-binding response OmpR family regulator